MRCWSPPRSRSTESDAATQITAGIDAAESRVRTAVPIATTIYLEPDIYRPQQPDRTDPSIRAVLRSRSSRPPRPAPGPPHPAPAPASPSPSPNPNPEDPSVP